MQKYLLALIITFSVIYSKSVQYSFKNLKNGYWLGEDLLPHPFQDWEIKDENAVCVVDKKLRKLEFLGFKFSEEPKNAVVVLNLKIDKEKIINNLNTGIEIGSEEYFNGQNWLGSKGVRIGIISDKLVILDGDEKIVESKKEILYFFQKTDEIQLKISFNYQKKKKGYDVILSIQSNSEKQKNSKESIEGFVFQHRLNSKKFFIFNKSLKRSVFYKSLIVSGEKIEFLEGSRLNPIFSPQYIIQENRLYLNVRFFPIDTEINNLEVVFYNSRGVKLFDKIAYVKKNIPSYLFVVDNWKFRIPIRYTIKLNYQKLNDEKKIYQRQGRVKPILKKKLKIITIGENNFFYQKNHVSPNNLKDNFVKDITRQRPDLIIYYPNQVDFRHGKKTPLYSRRRDYILSYLYSFYFFSSYYGSINGNVASIDVLGNKDFGQNFLWGSKFKRNQFTQLDGVSLSPKLISIIFNIRRGNLKFKNKDKVKKKLFARNPFSQKIFFKRAKVSFAVINNLFYRYSPKYFIKGFKLNEQRYDESLIIKSDKKFLFDSSQIEFLKNWNKDIEKTDYKKILITSRPLQDFSSLKNNDFFKQNKRKKKNKINSVSYINNSWPIKERNSFINNFNNITHFAVNSKYVGVFRYRDSSGKGKMDLYTHGAIVPNQFKKLSKSSDDFIDGFGNLIEKKSFFVNRKNTKIAYSVLTISKKGIDINYRQISKEKTFEQDYLIK